MRRLLLPCLALVLVAGCATFNQRELGYLQRKGVPPAVLAKLSEGEPLTPPEIIILTQRNVPDEFMLRHLRDNGVDYLVSEQDIVRMRRAGVSARVIDALLEECEDFARRYAEPQVEVHSGLWWVGSPYYAPGLYYDAW